MCLYMKKCALPGRASTPSPTFSEIVPPLEERFSTLKPTVWVSRSSIYIWDKRRHRHQSHPLCDTHHSCVLISKYCVCYFASKQTSPILARVTNHTGQSKYRVCKTRLVGNTSPKPNRKYTIPSIKDVILCLWNMKKLEINRCYQSNQNFFSESIYHVWNGCHAPINLLYMIFSNNTHTLDAQQLRGWDRCWYKQSNVIYRTYIVKYGELVLYLVKFARIIIFTDFTSIITYGN